MSLDFAIGTEVAMIVAGLWFALFARKTILELKATGAWPMRGRAPVGGP